MPSFPIVQMRKCNGCEWEKVNTFRDTVKMAQAIVLNYFFLVLEDSKAGAARPRS